MHYYEVAPNQIVRTDSDFFTYSFGKLLKVGQIVQIEVGKKQMIGVVLRKVEQPTYAIKQISMVVENTPLPVQLVNLAKWLSVYYVSPLASVLQTMLPSGIQKKRRATYGRPQITQRDRTNIVFNHEQLSALKTLSEHDSGTFLLQGVTGSGKTELYISVAKQAMNTGRSAIILVPEIALTSQLISEFSNHISNLIVTHSKMTESQRHQVWIESLQSTIPRVVIGPRSALFCPLKNIGVIVVDEAHEPSYKQEQTPKYSALRTATMLGRYHGARVVFGSATPNVVDRYLAEKSTNPILKLTSPARFGSIKPSIKLVDMTNRSNFRGHRFLSRQLIEQMTKTLAVKKQVLIFHNRRGSANTTLCTKCGWMAECPSCFLPLSLHSDSHQLRCHICGYNESVSTSCPVCAGVGIVHKGVGTKLVESELRKLFPKAKIARFDADNTNDEAINARYGELYKGNIDIAIGTQIVAKGLDLPQLRTVGIIQADTGLVMPDFNTNERTFQLLAQVVGRVGRNEHKTQVIIQTFKPTHPSIKYSLTQDYESFYKNTIEERKKSNFPPFTHLLKLTCIYKSESMAIKNARTLAIKLQGSTHKSVQILGPTPAFYERRYDTYRWKLVIKSPKREYLIDILKLIPPTHWQFELDPTSLL